MPSPNLGEQKTQAWLQGVVKDNLARPPKGGDTDQIKAVAAGECDIAVTNSYYFARLMRSNKPEDVALANKVGVVFPNQSSWGTHLNIAGGAVAIRQAPGQRCHLEYLARKPRNTWRTATTNGLPYKALNWATRRSKP